MERTTFLETYRVRLQYDGTPYTPDSNGPATSYEAVDERTGEPVSVTLLPADSVDPAERAKFEEHVSAAQKLRHVNIAKVFDFGREGDDYIYVSERVAGETLASWVGSHGSMPADAALRVSEQIVSVLSSADFHKLPYPSIQPSDIMLVPGQTAEGTWPLVKMTNFGLPPLATAELQLSGSESPTQIANGHEISSQRELRQTTRDIRWEVYSLGLTLYFLLTGVALSPEALTQGPKLSGFPKPLRTLLRRLLHRVPDQRPTDLLVVTELIRECLRKIERRRALSDRYGIPLRTSVPRLRRGNSRRLVQAAAIAGILVLLAAAIAPFVFPDSIGKLVRGRANSKHMGVLVGVPDSLSATRDPNTAAQAAGNSSSISPDFSSSQATNSGTVSQAPAPANAALTPNPFHVAPADVQQAQIASAQPQPSTSANSAETPGISSTPQRDALMDADAHSSAQAKANEPSLEASESTTPGKKKSVAATSKRPHSSRGSATQSARAAVGSMRSRVIGITSDGRLILRLPSGRTAIVAPDEEAPVPRRRHRVYINRDQMLGPPPGSEPDYFQGD